MLVSHDEDKTITDLLTDVAILFLNLCVHYCSDPTLFFWGGGSNYITGFFFSNGFFFQKILADRYIHRRNVSGIIKKSVQRRSRIWKDFFSFVWTRAVWHHLVHFFVEIRIFSIKISIQNYILCYNLLFITDERPKMGSFVSWGSLLSENFDFNLRGDISKTISIYFYC